MFRRAGGVEEVIVILGKKEDINIGEREDEDLDQ